METTTNMKLFQYQRDTVFAIDGFDGRSLLALEMGLGKTIIVLKWLSLNKEAMPALIVCPASIKHVWQHEAELHFGFQSSICNGRQPPVYNGGDFFTRAPLTIINYDVLSYWAKYLRKLKFKTIVFDECQYLISPKTKRTKSSKLVSTGVPHVLALSGTPLTNRPSELWPVLNILWQDKYPSFWSYAQEYCNPKKLPWGGWDFRGSRNLPQLHSNLLEQGMVRYRKQDVLKDLPEKVRRVIPCELRDYSEYKEASTDFMGWLKKNMGHKVRSAARAESLVRIGYLLRLAAKLKMKSVVEWANRFLEETDEKLILFAIHKKAIKVLQKRINAEAVTIDGSTSIRDRKLAVAQFQNNSKTRLFIGQIQAAGVGLTLTAASEVGFVEMSWRPGDHQQAEDRPHRIGQKRTVFVDYFVADNTIEVQLCKILEQKQKTISSVLDGDSNSDDLNIYHELVKVLSE